MSIVLFQKEAGILVQHSDDSQKIDHVPAYVYRLTMTQEGLLLAKDRKNFIVPEKYFGNVLTRRDIIVEEYKKTTNSLGIILFGRKGTGKSLLSESIANKLLELDIPVFYVESAIPPGLIKAVAKLVGPCLFLIEEFGKIYSEENQAEMVNLFSDSGYNKTMFILTGNGEDDINGNFLNRPGRFLFHIYYDGVDDDVLEEMMSSYELSDTYKFLFRIYNRFNPGSLNTDIFLKLIPYAKNAKSFHEFMELINLLNVPAMCGVQYTLERLMYKGKQTGFTVDTAFIDGVAEITVYVDNEIVEVLKWELGAINKPDGTPFLKGRGFYSNFGSNVKLGNNTTLHVSMTERGIKNIREENGDDKYVSFTIGKCKIMEGMEDYVRLSKKQIEEKEKEKTKSTGETAVDYTTQSVPSAQALSLRLPGFERSPKLDRGAVFETPEGIEGGIPVGRGFFMQPQQAGKSR